MTAVEQFFKDLCDLGFIEYPDDSLIQDRYNLALEIEKEQIMQAYKFNATGEPDGAEHYYEMFYKK
jgi:hypothetical protein